MTGFQCYGCTTTSNSTTDQCLNANVSSPIMAVNTCTSQSNGCYMESTSKDKKFNQKFII